MGRKIEQLYQNLQQLKIQGATAVAQAIITTLGPYIQKTKKKEDYREVKKIADYLLSARPTEAMARNGVYFTLLFLKGKNPSEVERLVVEKSQEFRHLTRETKQQLGRAGLQIFQKTKRILTHCHSSSVEAVLKTAWEKGIKFQVLNTETRPLFQGRITARHLLKAGIPTTMIPDSAGPFFLSPFSPSHIDFLIMGADAVLEDGSAVNKIGSYGLSLAAKENHIPVYIAASLLKYYPDSKIKIEERPSKEIWPGAFPNLKIVNLAFDQVPASNITAFVTEEGIVKPKNFSEKAFKLYPWLRGRKI